MLARSHGKTFMQLSAAATKTVGIENIAFIAIVIATCSKLLLAALLPLSGDEALYWTYSQNLSFGFIDHPFLNPLMISLGTSIFGDTGFGIRVMSIAASLVATFPVWRAGTILSGDPRCGALAALFFHMTFAVLIGGMVATSDILVITTSAYLLFFVAKLNETREQSWWLAIGTAIGVGMCAKYTTVFLVLGLFIWFFDERQKRRLLKSPWPFAGAIVSLLLFTPTLYWNFENSWASFVYQTSRLDGDAFTFRFVIEYLLGQVLLITPGIFYLCWRGLTKFHANLEAQKLLIALMAPALFYFLWHSLYERVQGNWLMILIPPVAVAAAIGTPKLGENISPKHIVSLVSIPIFSFGVFMLIGLHASIGLYQTGKDDPIAKELAYGMPDIAKRLNEISTEYDASLILTSDYTTHGWLYFYSDYKSKIHQLNERIRWVDAPQPTQKNLAHGRYIYVCRERKCYAEDFKKKYDRVELLMIVPRHRRNRDINMFRFFLLEGPKANVLDPVMPPMNVGGRCD